MRLEKGFCSTSNTRTPINIYIDKELADQIICVLMKAAKEAMDNGKYDVTLKILLSLRDLNELIESSEDREAEDAGEDEE